MMMDNPDPHQVCKSLIQKAVRRGDATLVRKVVSHFDRAGEADWLRQRTIVITYEECWPLGVDWGFSSDITDVSEHLVRVSQAVKYKDATGLGTLGYAFSQGDSSVFSGKEEDETIRIVADATLDPRVFWERLSRLSGDARQAAAVRAAETAYRDAGRPVDGAFVLAAAHLASIGNVPEPRKAASDTNSEVPFWVAIDKHTDAGRAALREAADYFQVPATQVFWCSFYFEGAKCNQAQPSWWWDREIAWRLQKEGITVSEVSGFGG
jgi:hypothetical protein